MREEIIINSLTKIPNTKRMIKCLYWSWPFFLNLIEGNPPYLILVQLFGNMVASRTQVPWKPPLNLSQDGERKDSY